MNKFYSFLLFIFISINTLLSETNKLDVGIDGMCCLRCAHRLEKKLEEIKEVDTVNICMKVAVPELQFGGKEENMINLRLKVDVAKIKLKPGENFNINDLGKAIVDAGFSMTGIAIQVTGRAKKDNDGIWKLISRNDEKLFFLKGKDQVLGERFEGQLDEAGKKGIPIKISGLVHEQENHYAAIVVNRIDEAR